MSEGLVNIDLPWYIPQYTYQQHIWMEVLELLQCWHGALLYFRPHQKGGAIDNQMRLCHHCSNSKTYILIC